MLYPKLDLYNNYLKYSCVGHAFPDVTCKMTMNRINYAINLCEKWDNFMDIGGGDGKNAIALSITFKKGTLVEIEKLDKHAEISKSFSNLSLFNDLIENYKTGIDTFDFILLSDLFEHIPVISTFVEQISNLQKVGGVIYIMTPNPIFCGPATESEIYYKKLKYGHVNHYTIQEMVHIMKKHNYELIFQYYEESHLRRKIKDIIKSMDRHDIKWSKFIVYRMTRPIVVPLVKSLNKFLELWVYNNEIRNSNNPFSTITHDLAFKKIL